MRTTLFVLVSSLTLSLSSAVLADTASTSAAAAAAPEPIAQSTLVPQATQTDSQGAGSTQKIAATVGDEKLICHHPVHEGTVLPQQVCLTQHAWELIRLREQKKVNDWQLHGYQARVK